VNLPVAQTDASPEAAANRLRIAETFTSIQGEGKLTGTPSHFIRVSGCNLRCAWCDTPYASWEPEGPTRTVEDLATEATKSGVRHVVVTGGEPMLFPAAAHLTSLLRDQGLHITIETAGTIFRDVACDLMSISPKLSNSTPGTPTRPDPRDPAGAWRARHESRRIDAAALQALIDAHPNRQLKFVVSRPTDLPEIENMLGTLRGWAADDVMLMPEGTTPPSSEVSTWVMQACTERGWRYCRRLHIDLFGNTRGT